MDYATLAALYDLLEQTPQRLKKTVHIADFLRQCSDTDIVPVVLLLQGIVYPIWDRRKLGFSSRSVVKAIARASGVGEWDVENTWRSTGDLGECARKMLALKRQRTLFSEKLTVTKVFATLRKLASTEGESSVDAKVGLVSELLTSAESREATFIVRTVLDELRIGLGDGTLRDALLAAFAAVSREDREAYTAAIGKIQRALDICNDFGIVAAALKKGGLAGLQDITLAVGVPLQVMLALKERTMADAFERVGTPAVLEYKLDGFRLQIHKKRNEVTLFTRRLENVTEQFPDVVRAMSAIDAVDCILDCEVVGVDAAGKFLSFQHISQRIKRKHDIAEVALTIPVQVHVFDILYNDGSLLEKPFSERRAILERVVRENSVVQLMKHVRCDTEEAAQAFYQQSLALGNEGIMFKKLDAAYQPGARVGSMVKMKPILETLDLVIVGAEWGEGKRSAWLSSYTVGCRNGDLLGDGLLDAHGLLEIGRVSTGLKEKPEEGLSFGQVSELLKPLVTSTTGKNVVVTPRLVIEVAFEEIQKSSSYGSGYALRFPRVVRLREDRDEKSCSTITDVKRIFEEQ